MNDKPTTASKGPKLELETLLKQAAAMADESNITSLRSASTTKASGQATRAVNVMFADGRALSLTIKPAKPKKN